MEEAGPSRAEQPQPHVRKRKRRQKKRTKLEERSQITSAEARKAVKANQSWVSKIWNYQPHPECWWVQIIEILDLPGLKEAAKPELHITVRLFWLLTFSSCFGLSIYVLLWAVGTFEEHPVQVVIEAVEMFTSLIPFPTVDAMLLSSFKISEILKIIGIITEAWMFDTATSHETIWQQNETGALFLCMNEICDSVSSFSSHLGVKEYQISTQKTIYNNWEEDFNIKQIDNATDPLFRDKIVPLLKSGLANCNDLVVACTWDGNATICMQRFRSTYSSLGGGCSYNRVAGKYFKKFNTTQSLFEDQEAQFDHQWEGFVMDAYLSTLKSKNDDLKNSEFPLRQKAFGQPTGLSMLLTADKDYYTCNQQDSKGFKIGVRALYEEMDLLKSGSTVPFNHEIFMAVTPEVILADEKIKTFTPEQRSCYFDGEMQLKYFIHYSRENCLTEKLSDDILKECNCTLLFSPKEPGNLICNPEQYKCAKRIEREKYTNNPEKIYSMCLPRCNSITYKYELSATPYDTKFPPEFLEQFQMGVENETVLIHVYMKSRTVQTKYRTLKHERWDKIGLLGGIGGFTIGVSFIQAAYLVAALVLLLILIYKWIRKYIKEKMRGPKWWWLVGRKVKKTKVSEISPDPKEMAFTIVRRKDANSLVHVSDTAFTDVTVINMGEALSI